MVLVVFCGVCGLGGLWVCGRAALGHPLPFSFKLHQIPHRFPGVLLAISFDFHQVWWCLMVLVVLVVFANFGGVGGFW